MAGLKNLNLADRICEEYGVDVEDMKILARIEQLLEENKPAEPPPSPPGAHNG